MKAIILKEVGDVNNLVQTELPTPKIKEAEVLIQVKALSINPVDVFVRARKEGLENIIQPKENEQPIILGWDVSGVVVKTGNAVTDFQEGDEVFGLVNFTGHGKAYAEYVAAPAKHLALKPQSTSHVEAAAAALAALTAYHAILTHAKTTKGDKVLIHSAAGGVGHYAVQVAKYLGAYVIGTGAATSKDFILGLGADAFIDYENERFEEVVTDADVVLDAVPVLGHLERSVNALKNGGRLIGLLGVIDERLSKKLATKNAYGLRYGVQSDGAAMAVIANWLEKGIIRSHVSRVFPFEGLPSAHSHIETRKTKGKIVVTI